MDGLMIMIFKSSCSLSHRTPISWFYGFRVFFFFFFAHWKNWIETVTLLTCVGGHGIVVHVLCVS